MLCTKCGSEISETDYFCPQCGVKIRNPRLSVSFGAQAKAYLVSALFPPFGLWYAYRYMKNGDAQSKKIALAVVLVNLVFFFITLWLAGKMLDYANREVEQQLNAFTF